MARPPGVFVQPVTMTEGRRLQAEEKNVRSAVFSPGIARSDLAAAAQVSCRAASSFIAESAIMNCTPCRSATGVNLPPGFTRSYNCPARSVANPPRHPGPFHVPCSGGIGEGSRWWGFRQSGRTQYTDPPRTRSVRAPGGRAVRRRGTAKDPAAPARHPCPEVTPPDPRIGAPKQELHIHFHSVSAEDVAAILAKRNRLDGPHV